MGPLGARAILKSAARTSFAAFVMGGALLAVTRYVDIEASWAIWKKAAVLMGLIAGAAAVYIAIIRSISPEEFKALMHLVRRRKKLSDLSPDTTG